MGLCEEGLVKGIESGKYTKLYNGSESPNKIHAIDAYNKIKEDNKYADLNPGELWEELNLGTKSHNNQMDVVLGLWKKEVLEK